MRSGFWISIFGLFLAGHSVAQDVFRVPDLGGLEMARTPRINLLDVNLGRDLNTFNWTGRALVDTTAMGTIVKMTEQYASNIILLDGSTASSGQLRSDQQNLSLLVGRPVTETLLSELVWSSVVYSDNKSVGLGHSSFHAVLGGFDYSPVQFIALNPLFGYRWDNQAGVKDKGLSYTLGMRTDSVDLDGYQLAGKAQFHEDRLNPRLLERDIAHVGAQKLFATATRDSLDVGFSRNRSEFYDVPDGNIESRGENITSFTNLLDYEIEPRLVTSLFVKVTNRSLERNIRHYSAIPGPVVRFNTTIDEFRLETFWQMAFQSGDGGFLASARLAHDERNEQHAAVEIPGASAAMEALFNAQDKEEKSKDNLTRHTSLAGMLRLSLSSSDTLFLSGAASILRYDTPADLAAEARVDRDEQLLALSVATVHRVSRYLDLGVTLDGNVNHIVYLFSAWSGNNSYNRVLRLSPTTTFRPVRTVASANTFEVLANYTVYDFEQLVTDVHSYSYRQFGWTDSSSVELTSRVGFDFYSHLKLYERGQLNWSDFSERMENSFVDKTISSQVRFSPEAGLLFAVGVRYFSQTRYAYSTGDKVLDLFTRSLGPTCFILWDVGPHSRVMVKGWYERRTSSAGQGQPVEVARTLPNLTMNIAINL